MTRICSCSGGSASMLEISRKGKQLKKAACGTCGGRPLVDGIEPESASMLSTVDLELSSFINPELTWKKVKKGCRTTTRRSRKSVNQSLNVGAESGSKSRKRDQDSSVSESEKHGVAVLGRRFAEKIVNVPIKKRRYSIRPPSPPPRTPSPDHESSLSPQPQTPSPHPIESDQLVDIKFSGAGRQCSQDFHSNCKKRVFDKSVGLKIEDEVDEVRNGNKSEIINAGNGNDDDFSGIELLAAAACGSSLDNDVKLKETFAVKAYSKAEAVDSPNATLPLKESIASSGTSHFSDKDLVNEDDMGESAVNEIAAVNKNENGGVAKNRAHWDLNTVMEAWEEPDDVAPVNSQINCSEIAPCGTICENINVENSLIQSNLEDVCGDAERVKQPVMCKDVPSNVEGNKELADGIGAAAIRSCFKEVTLKTCSSLKGTCIEKQYGTTPTERVQEALSFVVCDTIAYNPLTRIEASGNHLCTKSLQTESIHVFEEKMHASNSELKQVREASCGTSFEEYKKLLSGGSEVGKLEIVTPNLPCSNNVVHEINDTRIRDSNVFESTHGSPDSKTTPGQVISTVTYKTSDVGNSTGELDRASGHFHPSPKGEALSASSTSVVVGEVKLLADKSSAVDNNMNDAPLQNGPMGLFDKSNNCQSKTDQDNNVSDCYNSYGKDGKKVNLDHISEYEAGYDSSFEDGELREPGVYTWEENDLEGETEYVDYGSEYGDDFDTVNSKSANAENGQGGCQSSRKGTLLVKTNDIEKVCAGGNRLAVADNSVKSLDQCFSGDALDGSHSACLKTKISGGDQFNERLEYRVTDGKVAGYDDKGLYGEFGSMEFRGNLPSFSRGPSPFDAAERRISVGLHRNRFDNSNYSYSQAERNFGPQKSTGRGRFSIKPFGSRNDTDGRWVDSPISYRDTRNRYTHSYRGPESRAYSRPRDSNATSGTKIGGFNRDDDRRPTNYSSNNGPYRPFMGRRSLTDGDDSYFGPHGSPPVRNIGQERSRGRSGRYVQGIRRGPRDEYSEDIPDDASLRPIRRQPNFSRRERGFSPNYGGAQFMRSRRNSCSRSQTRSPVAWNSQRERNMNTRRRSPDFRSDARMERIRSPFQKTSFGADNEEIYVSPPRSRVSTNSNSRWFNDGNYMDNQFRDRRSPVRMFRRSQRLDSVGYSGRKSDGIFQPNIRRERFQQVSSTGRGPDIEGSDDEKRKHDDRHEINHRVRRYDAGGAVRRFRYDADNCFEARNAHKDDGFRPAIKRDTPRNGAGEERGPRYNSDRMYASASSAGQRDYNEDAAVGEE